MIVARYEAELLQRKESEEKVHQLEEQISFNDELNRQQQQDLQDRLAAANTAILNLEGKVKVLDRPDYEKHVAEMLSSVRDAAERELYKYKQDAEETFSRNVSASTADVSFYQISWLEDIGTPCFQSL